MSLHKIFLLAAVSVLGGVLLSETLLTFVPQHVILQGWRFLPISKIEMISDRPLQRPISGQNKTDRLQNGPTIIKEAPLPPVSPVNREPWRWEVG